MHRARLGQGRPFGGVGAIGILCVLSVAVAAGGASRTWDGGPGGAGTDWFDPANWDPDGAPAPQDLLRIGGGFAPTAAAPILTDGGGRITFEGAGAGVGGSPRITVGLTGLGRLEIAAAALLSNPNVLIGDAAGAFGIVNVAGRDPTFPFLLSTLDTQGSALTIGNLGTGRVSLADGGQLFAADLLLGAGAGGMGVLEIDGPDAGVVNAGPITVGVRGKGYVSLSRGATLSNSNVMIGDLPGSEGAVIVHGRDPGLPFLMSMLDTQGGPLTIGRQGAGRVQLSDGGQLAAGPLTLGAEPGGFGTLAIAGPEAELANLTDPVFVGSQGGGRLILEAGAILNHSAVMIADQAGSHGTVFVRGSDPPQPFVKSTWNANGAPLLIARQGVGAVVLSDGGRLVADDIFFGAEPGSFGSLVIDGPEARLVSASPLLFLGIEGAGHVELRNGAVLHSPTVIMGLLPESRSTVVVRGGDPASPANRSTFDTVGAPLVVGQYGAGGVILAEGGRLATPEIYLGADADAVGTLTIDGPGSGLAGPAPLIYVGLQGTGRLNVTGGALLTNPGLIIAEQAGSNGIVKVSGHDPAAPANRSTLDTAGNALAIGFSGNGALVLSNGGQLVGADVFLGIAPGGMGALTISGPDAGMTGASVIVVGFDGTGFLTLSRGAVLRHDNVWIGEAVGANGSVFVGGSAPGAPASVSTFDTAGTPLTIGGSGTGKLMLYQGGRLACGDLTLGRDADAFGTLALDGPEAAIAAAPRITVGGRGVGRLNLTGGAVLANPNVVIGEQPGSAGTVDVRGTEAGHPLNVSTLDVGSGPLTIGGHGTGSVVLADGGRLISGDLHLGRDADGFGALIIDGPEAGISSGVSLIAVGWDGKGHLDLADGAVLDHSNVRIGDRAGSVGTMSVRGVDPGNPLNPSTFDTGGTPLTLGRAGTGRLLLLDGGRLISGTVVLGGEGGGKGTLTVHGTGSGLSGTPTIFVGQAGAGWLNVTGGAVLTNPNVHVGDPPGSAGTVSVRDAGSAFDAAGPLTIGDEGLGAVLLSGGGQLIATGIVLGGQATGLGALTIDGAGSGLASAPPITVGLDGAGYLTVRNGAALNHSNVVLGQNAGSRGIVTVRDAGSVFDTGGASLAVGTLGGTGKLIVFDGGQVTVGGQLRIGPRGTLAGSGTINGDVVNNGLIDVGLPVGTMAVNGDVTHTGILRIEVTDATTFDTLLVSGDVTLGGTLDVLLPAPFSLSVGQQLVFLDVGGALTGQFVGLNEGDFVAGAGGLDLFITYLGGNGNDVALYTDTTTIVSTALGGGIGVVPEPTAAALLAIGACASLRRRRRKGRP